MGCLHSLRPPGRWPRRRQPRPLGRKPRVVGSSPWFWHGDKLDKAQHMDYMICTLCIYIYIYISTYKYICTSSYIYVHMGSYIIWGLSIVNFGCFSRWDYVVPPSIGFPNRTRAILRWLGAQGSVWHRPRVVGVDLVQRKSVFKQHPRWEKASCQFRGLNQEALLLAAGFNMVEWCSRKVGLPVNGCPSCWVGDERSSTIYNLLWLACGFAQPSDVIVAY